MKKYKNLFFDLDGTISDSYEGITKLFKQTFEHFGVSVPEYEYRGFVGPPVNRTFGKYFKTQEEIVKVKDYFRDAYLKDNRNTKLFPGIKETIAELKRRGYKIYTATSKREDQAVDVMEYLGVAEYFDTIYGADGDKRVEKEQVLEYAVAGSGAKIAESVLIGDTIFDLAGAKYCGMDAIWASYGYGTKQTIGGLPYVFEAKQAKDLLDYLK